MSSQPATMAEAAGSGPAPLHRGLPDEIAVWEILVRLPPKAVLRCRAVCPAWRQATSNRDFLLAHHARQPTLPLVSGYNIAAADDNSLDIIPFDHRAADQLQPVARLHGMHPVASCDGLLINAEYASQFSICNPATHQYAPLTELYGYRVLGMYRHSATGEYRLLLRKLSNLAHRYASYVLTLGSGQSPRHIGYPEAAEMISTTTVLFGGNLHWHIERNLSLSENPGNLIIVFDTTAELFRQMQALAVPGYAGLFQMGDVLGMASLNRARTIVDIWVMQDYESEVWAFKWQIALPAEELRMRNLREVAVMPIDGDLLVLVETEDRLHHVDINGKLVASFHRRGLNLTQLLLKQTLVPHTFFPTLEGYVVNGSPFI